MDDLQTYEYNGENNDNAYHSSQTNTRVANSKIGSIGNGSNTIATNSNFNLF